MSLVEISAILFGFFIGYWVIFYFMPKSKKKSEDQGASGDLPRESE